VWHPFLYYAMGARDYLLKYKGVSYRGIDKPVLAISKQYRQGGVVTFIAFTSTSKDKDVINNFNSLEEGGMWFILEGYDGIEVPFSLFPTESEVLYFPNTTFTVTNVLIKSEMKKLASIPSNLDVLQLQQKSSG